MLADNLKRIRLERGLSLRKLGKMAGVHYMLIYKYEYGISDPYSKNVVKLCMALGISADELLGLNELNKDKGDI